MMTVRRLLVPFLSLALFAASPAFAQTQHVVPPQQLAAAVDSHVANQDADRAAIHQALKRADVQHVAATMRLDLGRANAAVDTMTGDDLVQAASAARQINDDLVGGASTIVISTTTIIIALLVLILLIVALR